MAAVESKHDSDSNDSNATKEYAMTMDEADPLKEFRSRFAIPDAPSTASRKKSIYFRPMMIGIPPRDTRLNIDSVIKKWGDSVDIPLGFEDECNKLLVPLLGAKNEKEVSVMNGTSVNGHFLMISFYRPTYGRYKILCDGTQFATEHHIIQSQLQMHGLDETTDAVIDIHEGTDSLIADNQHIIELIHSHKSSIAMVWLECAHHLTGQVYAIDTICAAAAQYGIVVALDVAQGVGNVPLKLHEWGVDFAIFAGYKYLSAGIGATGGAFVHEKHHSDTKLMRLTGWWGQSMEDKFSYDAEFKPFIGASSWSLVCPSLLHCTALTTSLKIFNEAKVDRLRAKSVLLTNYLESLIEVHLKDALRVMTPSKEEERGCQLAVEVLNGVNAHHLNQYLGSQGALCGSHPRYNVLRIAPMPTYNTFMECWEFMLILKGYFESKLYEKAVSEEEVTANSEQKKDSMKELIQNTDDLYISGALDDILNSQ